MEHKVAVEHSTVVCGLLQDDPVCVCLRTPGHWGPHVVLNQWGEFFLKQTSCMPITFKIEAVVAQKAIDDPEWVWEG